MKKFGGLANIAVVVLMALVLLTAIGCDEGMEMAGDVIGSVDPIDPVDPTMNGEVKDPDPTMNGEVKDPDPTMNGGSTDPVPPSIHPSLAEEPITPIIFEYTDGIAIGDRLPLSAWVLDFPGPYQEYAPPESNPGDFVGRVCMDADGNWAASGYVAPVSLAIVTITDGPRAGEQVVTDEGGYYLFPNVAGDNLYLRVERAYLEPKEVIAYRSSPTELQRLRPNEVFNAEYQNREGLDNVPGMILVGIRWPDAVRFILEDEPLPHDVLLSVHPATRTIAGGYGSHEVLIYNRPEYHNEIAYSVLLHELAHARQHAVALLHGFTVPSHYSGTKNWKNTPEGKAYREAWEKDLEEIPRDLWLSTFDGNEYFATSINENAAQFCYYYWKTATGEGQLLPLEIVLNGGLQKVTPNRYKWAETYLNTHPD